MAGLGWDRGDWADEAGPAHRSLPAERFLGHCHHEHSEPPAGQGEIALGKGLLAELFGEYLFPQLFVY